MNIGDHLRREASDVGRIWSGKWKTYQLHNSGGSGFSIGGTWGGAKRGSIFNVCEMRSGAGHIPKKSE